MKTFTIISIIAMLFLSCQFLETETEYTIVVDEEDFSWVKYQPVEDYRLSWIDGLGNRGSAFTGKDRHYNLNLTKGIPAIVLIRPDYGRLTTDYPAAILIHGDEQRTRYHTQTQTAPLAQALFNVVDQGIPLRFFNLVKWEREFRKETNPWLLDIPKLSTDMQRDEANSLSIDFHPTCTVQLSGLPEGLYIPENPFLPGFFVDSNGKTECELPVGFHRCLLCGQATILEISVYGNGRAYWLLRAMPSVKGE